MLTLSWSDGNTLIPVNSCLLASSKGSNIIGPVKAFDKRTLAGKRRALAQKKAPEAMMDLLCSAKSVGLTADYVLFDSWFSNPAQITAIKANGMDVIAMIKKSSRIDYIYEGKMLNIKEIYSKTRSVVVVQDTYSALMLCLEKTILFLPKSYVFVTRLTERIGLPSYAQILLLVKKKSLESMASAGRLRFSSKPVNPC